MNTKLKRTFAGILTALMLLSSVNIAAFATADGTIEPTTQMTDQTSTTVTGTDQIDLPSPNIEPTTPPAATSTPMPDSSQLPSPMETPAPTETPSSAELPMPDAEPSATPTPAATPAPTDMPEPTATPEPEDNTYAQGESIRYIFSVKSAASADALEPLFPITVALYGTNPEGTFKLKEEQITFDRLFNSEENCYTAESVFDLGGLPRYTSLSVMADAYASGTLQYAYDENYETIIARAEGYVFAFDTESGMLRITVKDENEDEDEEKLFPGMPEGYLLSDEQIAMKQALNNNGVLDTLYNAVPGVDYADGEVFFLADTYEYALMVAEAYGAALSDYSCGVATIALNGATVLDAVTAAADMSNNMPVVEANYACDIIPVVGFANSSASAYAYSDENGIPQKGSWKTWLESTNNPDPFLKDPSGLNLPYQYMHDVVNTYEAWGVTQGDGVTVAVLDSGVAYHDDLNNNVIARESVNSEWGELEAAHGTHVAGIVAAEMGNGLGGAGVAPKAKIYSMRVFKGMNGWTSNIAIGVMNVIAAKASNDSIKVMNMSLGTNTYSVYYEETIREAVSAGITVVAAMGNNGSNIRSYPAALDIPGVIAVQSSNEADNISYFSNYGAWADVAAPGSNILSTVLGNTYDIMNGTSMATPAVAGVCALYLSVYPDATPTQVEAAIKKATNNGIVDASKLFGSENKAPAITSEAAKDASGALPYGSKLNISASDSSETIIYTVDGQIPSVSNGVVTGTVVQSGEFALDITAENGFNVGKYVTVKAVAVNGMGVIGKVASFSFNVGYAQPTDVKISISTEKLESGKNFTLSANVLPAEANQKVLWKVDKGECSNTKINENTGVLSTGTNDKGTVIVSAYSAEDNTKIDSVEINIEPLDLTKKITITADGSSMKSLALYINSTAASDPVQLEGISYKASDIKTPVTTDSYIWTSSNTKVATVSEDGLVSAVGKGSAAITCKAKDGTNVKANISVTVRLCADEISISGLSTVSPGKTTKYTVSFNPKTTQYKTVAWTIEDDNDQGITISRTGQITVPKTVKPGTEFKICASSGLTASAEKTVRVNAGITNVKVINNDPTFGGLYKQVNDGRLKEATLFTTDFYNGAEKHFDSIQLGLMNDAYCDLIWKSSNPKIATVDENGVVKAKSVGRTTVTCKASDAGGKSCSVSIVVINPASSVKAVTTKTISAAYSNPVFVSGTTVSNKAVIGDAHGTPTIKKLAWDYSVRAVKSVSDMPDCTAYAKANKLFSINASTGKLTSSKNAYSRLLSYTGEGYQYIVIIRATATDGSNVYGEVIYGLLASPISKLYVEYEGKNYSYLNYPKVLTKEIGSAELPVLSQNADGSTEICYNWTVKSSNPNVAGAMLTQTDKDGVKVAAVAIAAGQKAGRATITLTAADGSNKTARIVVTVK